MGSTKVVDPYMGLPNRDLMNQYINSLFPYIDKGVEMPAFMPGATNLQQQGFNVAGGFTPVVQALQEYSQNILGNAPQTDFLGQAAQGYGQLMQPYSPEAAMAAQKPVFDFANQRFWSDFAPQAAEKYLAGSGAKASGGFDRTLTRGFADMNANIAAQLGQNIFAGEQNQLNRMQQAIGMAPYLQNAPAQLAGQSALLGGDITSQLLGAGQQQYGIQANQAQENANRWNMGQWYGSPYQPLFQTAFGIPGNDVFVKGSGPSSASMLGGAALGALGSAFGGYLGGGGTGGLGGFFGSLW